MEIYILRNNEEHGPYSEEAVQALLKQGEVLIGDMAWTAGMPEWLPLHSVLYPAPASPPPVAAVPFAPATEKQKAFLAYMGLAVPPDLTKEQAAMMVTEQHEEGRNAARLARWNEDRLRLHPELFAEELHARREERAPRFFEVCQTEGADVLTGVTRAHCQVLLGYLDVAHPRWDANEKDAAWSYFFPAVAEKFPQLVQKEWKDKLAYPVGPKVAPELHRTLSPRATKALKQRGPSPVAAVGRGFTFALVLLAFAVGGVWLSKSSKTRARLQQQWNDLVATQPPPVLKKATPPPAETLPEPVPAVAAVAPVQEPAPAPLAEPTMPAGAPADAAAPTLFDPLAVSGMAPTDAAAPPMATAGGPPPATLPGMKSTVMLTKPAEVQAKYGKIKIPSGTPLRVVGQSGTSLQVSWQNQIYSIPASSTDINEGM